MARSALMLDAEVAVRLGRLDLSVHLECAAGEVVALLGPNGAGKSTIIRSLAGLQPLDSGHVRLDGALLDDPGEPRWIPPERRSIGVVFQDHLLFPHLTLLDNVAFGLRARGMSRNASDAAALTRLERVGLGDHSRSKPPQVSGGQAQRCALARALATDPALLLLDEPLASLDATSSAATRRDLRRHLSDFAGAAILVTHDPLDALALADRVAVVEHGRITQTGSIAQVAATPRTPYAAALFGLNLLRGRRRSDTTVELPDATAGTHVTVVDAPGLDAPDALLVIRPSSVLLHRSPSGTSARNQWEFRIEGLDLAADRVRVRLHGAFDLVAEVTPSAVDDLELVDGSTVWASVEATDITVIGA